MSLIRSVFGVMVLVLLCGAGEYSDTATGLPADASALDCRTSGTNVKPCDSNNPLYVAADPLFPIQGQIASVTTSVSIGTLATAVNSSAWAMPLAGGAFTVKNLDVGTSPGPLAVCPLGGTCSCATAPDILRVGESGTYTIGSVTTTPPTIVGCSGANDAVGVLAR